MRLLFLISFFFAFMNHSSAYSLFCRGPFEVITRIPNMPAGGPFIKFKRGTSKAGPNGQSLLKGTCAWADRGVAADEPNLLLINASNNVNYPEYTLESLFARIRDDHRRRGIYEARLPYFTRSDYVVEVDSLQNMTDKFLYIVDDYFRDDAFLRLIPKPLP